MPARILIVDDHEIVREGLISLLAKWRPEWQICGEAASGDQAIEAIRQLRPDLVIMDISMPGINGLEASSRIRQLGLTCPVLIFTMHESERLVTDVLRSGAQGFVLKSQAGRDLVRAIDALLRGGTFFGAPPQTGPAGDAEPSSGTILGLALPWARAEGWIDQPQRDSV
jgi:DNA-binding NarL/FixJ family response regulator